jgi:tetratricopeptide (TPR) repeat protein
MARLRLPVVLVVVALAVVVTLRAGPPGSPEGGRIDTLLAVQTALQQGRDHLQRGHYLAAVQTLEARLELIDGHRDYLRTLRDAYLGLIRELHQANKSDEAETYVRRLKQIDPGALLELPGRNATPTVPLAAAQPPVPATPPAPTPTPTPAPTPTPTPTPAPTWPPAVQAPLQAPVLPTGQPAPNPFARTQNSGTTPAALAAGSVNVPLPGGEPTVRGVAGTDPFANENSTQMQEARGFLARAEREFADRNYPQALRFYDLTSSLAPKLLGESRDRWAYCKLHGVVIALNQPGTAANSQELEHEVRDAIAMAPEKLNNFGQELLRKIQDRQAGGSAGSNVAPVSAGEFPVEVRHSPRQGAWALAETANFRLYHNVSQDTAEKALRLAESTRLTMTRKWFNENPAPWNPRCDVYLHATGQEYAHATQQSPSVPGHSTIQNEGERILSRRIDLHVDDPNALVGVLPHETTHVVLAGRFGPKPLPRWADEGLAVLSEPPDRIQRHLNNLPQHYRDGLLFKLSHLMNMDSYPDARSVGAFYAEGVSLCDYMVAKKGPLVFTQFLRDGLRGGWEPAIQKHYGLRGYNELEQQWLASATTGQMARRD